VKKLGIFSALTNYKLSSRCTSVPDTFVS